MPNEFWAAIIGAVVGATVGGLIAFMIQKVALRASAEQLENEARERRKALGYALLFKIVRIHSGLENLRRHLEISLCKLETEECAGWEPWQVVRPTANFADSVHFSTDEVAMLLSLKDNDLFNDLISLDMIHNSTVELFRFHAALRESLLENLPANMEGIVGEITLSAEQAMYVRPKMVEINELVTTLNANCIQDTDRAWDVLERLNTILNDKLELGVSVVPKGNATK